MVHSSPSCRGWSILYLIQMKFSIQTDKVVGQAIEQGKVPVPLEIVIPSSGYKVFVNGLEILPSSMKQFSGIVPTIYTTTGLPTIISWSFTLKTHSNIFINNENQCLQEIDTQTNCNMSYVPCQNNINVENNG